MTKPKHPEKFVVKLAPRGASRLISKGELLERVAITYPNIWQKMRDGTFPRSVVVGAKSMWIESEVDAWIAALPRRRLKGDSNVA
jgi:predicted DNA-binding transcriptional regulator AlpA